MLTTGFFQPGPHCQVLYQAAPLLMCGLSVGFAFKTGLFNIGAPGQYTMGAFFAIMCATNSRCPGWACLIASMLGGAIWGLFPASLKRCST